MVPVQKSKQSSSLTNFWPISILPVFSKVLKWLIILLHIIYIQINNLAFIVGILHKMCYYMSLVHGLRQLLTVESLWEPFLDPAN